MQSLAYRNAGLGRQRRGARRGPPPSAGSSTVVEARGPRPTPRPGPLERRRACRRSGASPPGTGRSAGRTARGHWRTRPRCRRTTPRRRPPRRRTARPVATGPTGADGRTVERAAGTWTRVDVDLGQPLVGSKLGGVARRRRRTRRPRTSAPVPAGVVGQGQHEARPPAPTADRDRPPRFPGRVDDAAGSRREPTAGQRRLEELGAPDVRRRPSGRWPRRPRPCGEERARARTTRPSSSSTTASSATP